MQFFNFLLEGGGGGSAGVPPLFLEGDSSRGPRQDPDDEDGEG